MDGGVWWATVHGVAKSDTNGGVWWATVHGVAKSDTTEQPL